MPDDTESSAPAYACEDGRTIRRRMQEIASEQEYAAALATMRRDAPAPPATFNTGFVIYQGPPTA